MIDLYDSIVVELFIVLRVQDITYGPSLRALMQESREVQQASIHSTPILLLLLILIINPSVVVIIELYSSHSEVLAEHCNPPAYTCMILRRRLVARSTPTGRRSERDRSI